MTVLLLFPQSTQVGGIFFISALCAFLDDKMRGLQVREILYRHALPFEEIIDGLRLSGKDAVIIRDEHSPFHDARIKMFKYRNGRLIDISIEIEERYLEVRMRLRIRRNGLHRIALDKLHVCLEAFFLYD